MTLLAHRDSTIDVPFVPWPGTSSALPLDTLRNSLALVRHVERFHPDVIASFSRIAYLLPLLPFRIPKVMTYHRAITRRSVEMGHRLSRGTLHFTAISRWMTRDVGSIGTWSMVPNCIPLPSYELKTRVDDDAPLVFLGRFEEIKGPHNAIEIARRSGRRLVMAGNVPSEKKDWFDEHVRPHIDGDRIQFIGEVDDAQKNALLGNAAALVMAIEWEEPFGLVMTEALACGTPVLGLRRGAVPEVVDDGVTGFVRDSVEALAACVGRLDSLDRGACRAAVEQRYSEDVVVEGYLAAYRKAIAAVRRR